MSNPFFDFATASRFVKFDTVRAADVNAALDLVTAGFDMLPIPASLWGGKANFAVDSGAANAYVVSVAPTYITSYTDGLLVRMRPLNASTGASTINVNGLGVKSIKLMNGDALGAGNIAAGVPVDLVYSSVTGFFHVVGGLGATGATGATGANGAAGQSIVRDARTSNTILGYLDAIKLIDITSGTFSQTFAAAATLGSGWFCYIRNSGTGDVTLDPDGAETIDGLASFVMYPGEVRLVQCDGSALRSVVLTSFYKTFTASDNFIKPPGYSNFGCRLTGGGGSGRKHSTASNKSGGAGGACPLFEVTASALAATESVVIAAGGVAISADATNGNAGGDSTFAGITAYGGAGGNSTSSIGGGAFRSGNTGAFPVTGGATGSSLSNTYLGGGASKSAASTDGTTIHGGGGGGGITSADVLVDPTSTIHGGAGGASVLAAPGVDGTAPGGGGGATKTGATSGAGARGELKIWGIV